MEPTKIIHPNLKDLSPFNTSQETLRLENRGRLFVAIHLLVMNGEHIAAADGALRNTVFMQQSVPKTETETEKEIIVKADTHSHSAELGCKVVEEAVPLLKLPPRAAFASQAILQHYLQSLTPATQSVDIGPPSEDSGLVIAMASLLLGAKALDQPRPVRDIMQVCYHASHRSQGPGGQGRRLEVGTTEYVRLKHQVGACEMAILRCIGFRLYPLAADLPRDYVAPLVASLGCCAPTEPRTQQLHEQAVHLADRGVSCVCFAVRQLSAAQIAAVAVYLAARKVGLFVPDAQWQQLTCAQQPLLLQSEQLRDLADTLHAHDAWKRGG
jgi:hypothetical protein